MKEMWKSFKIEFNKLIGRSYMLNKTSCVIHNTLKADIKCDIDDIERYEFLTFDEARDRIEEGTAKACKWCAKELNKTIRHGN
jgi:hypothetical protein